MSSSLKFIILEERIVLDAAAIAHVIYVNAQAATNGNGASWAHAFNNLHDALAAAASTTGAEQIWIAKGTYTPDQGTTLSNLDTFNLPSNVSLYGGFLSGMNSLSQRNPTQNPTILSGSLGGGVQSLNVVTVNGSTNDLIDSVSIVNGNASGVGGDDSGGGVLLENGGSLTLNKDILSNNSAANQGGAIFSSNDSILTVTNSTFTGNSATTGGAIEALNANLTLSFDTFTNNNALLGGAVFVESLFETHSHTYSVDHSLFQNNTSVVAGGGMVAQGIGALSTTLVNIQSSVFDHNVTTVGAGGGILMSNIVTNINASSFTNNTTSFFGGGVCFNNLTAFATGTPEVGHLTLTNSLIANNTEVGNPALLPVFFGIISSVFGVSGGGIIGGGGLTVHEDASAVVSNNIFIGNTALNGDGGAILNGGAIFSLDSNPSVLGLEGGITIATNNIMIDNTATNGGGIASEGAVSLASLNSPVILTATNNAITSNSATNSGGGLYLNHTQATITKNIFALNSATTADEVYGNDAVINGKLSSSSAALISLLTNNLFLTLDSGDIVLS